MDIERNEEFEIYFTELVRQWLEEEREFNMDNAVPVLTEKRRPGMHLYDTLYTRKWYFGKREPEKLGERQVNYFSVGKMMEAAFLGIIDIPGGPKEVKIDDLTGTVDFFGNVPEGYKGGFDPGERIFEVKTARGWKISEVSEGYIQQVWRYCAASGCKDGTFVFFYLNTPKIVAWDITFDDTDLKFKLDDVREIVEKLKEGDEKDDFDIIPSCAEITRNDRWCKNCSYWSPCCMS